MALLKEKLRGSITSPFGNNYLVEKYTDPAAEAMQHNWQMNKRFLAEFRAGSGFSPDVANWGFAQLTGINLSQPKRSVNSPTLQSLALGAAVTSPLSIDRIRTVQSERDFEVLADSAQAGDGLFDGWNRIENSPLQKMIAQAAKDPEACLLGGGLPPVELILDFHDGIFLPALAKMQNWSREEKVEIHQYPNAGGATRHREAVIDHFLRPGERQTINDNFSTEHRADGLFFTNGSQEALSMMVEMLVTQEKATPEHPVELAVTDPTYPGLLMAADKFLQQGVLKFRIVPIDETGKIDTEALKTALTIEKCKAFYLAEGNPLPKQITNLQEVADVFQKSEYQDKLIFDDHAYDDLGATVENNLFDLLPNRVVSFKTLSKKAAPFRVGFVYSNMTPERFQFIRETMLKYQYDSKLGFSGVLSGTVAAILQLDAETNVFTKHIKKAQAYYEAQRQLYETTFKEALNLVFGADGYKLDDEVSIGRNMFMFGWRNTHHVSADLYARAGAEIKLYSLSGSTCRPKPEHITGDQSSDSPTLHHLRQNYTWIKPENLRLGIYKDVLLQIIFSEDMPAETKETVVKRLYEKMMKLNSGKSLPEVDQFIQKVSANGWQYKIG